jgi:hypothetical protein
MSLKPETLFKQRVLVDLKTLKNTWCYKSQEISRRGIPDIIACVNGKFCALELKATDTRGDDLQEYILKKIRACEGIALIVHPGNWREVFGLLQKIDNFSNYDLMLDSFREAVSQVKPCG